MPYLLLAMSDSSGLDAGHAVAQFLSCQGHRVETVSDGLEAACLIASERPDVLVTDLALPGRDGLELIRDLSTLPVEKRTAVVVITSVGSELGAVLPLYWQLKEVVESVVVKPSRGGRPASSEVRYAFREQILLAVGQAMARLGLTMMNFPHAHPADVLVDGNE